MTYAIYALQVRARFTELDVERSVEVLLREDPAFFESDAFRRGISKGDFLNVDYDYFTRHLCDILREALEHSEEEQHVTEEYRQGAHLRRMLEDYIRDESMHKLCDYLLPEMTDEDIQNLIRDIKEYHYAKMSETITRDTNNIVAKYVIIDSGLESFEDLLFYNALASFGGRVIRLLKAQGEEGEEVSYIIVDWLDKHSLLLTNSAEKQKDLVSHYALRREIAQHASTQEHCRFIVLECFLLRFRLSMCFQDRKSLKVILQAEGIEHKSIYSEEEQESKKAKKKRKKRKKQGQFVGWRFTEDDRKE